MSDSGKNDIESSLTEPLYPEMQENPEFRWMFIRKVYSIVTLQLLLTVAVASLVVSVPSVTLFFATWPGMAVYIAIVLAAILVLIPLVFYHDRHPVNYILLGVFTLCFSFAVGVCCIFVSGNVILEASILTATLVLSLTAYTFWAAKRGHDFSFLTVFAVGALCVLLVFGCIQCFCPLGRIGTMIYALAGVVLSCAYIVFDTQLLITRYTYDEHILAAVMLYLDIVNLFLYLVKLMKAASE